MAETKTWLETEAPALLRTGGTKLDSRYGILTIITRGVERVQLDSCVLSWTAWRIHELKSSLRNTKDSSSSLTRVPLTDLDVGGMRSLVDSLLTSPMHYVTMRTRSTAGKTIKTWVNGELKYTEDIASLFVSGPDNAARIIAAITHASKLCGAPASPF